MHSPVMILAVFTSALALLGVLAHLYGWDSRDDFDDQAHRPNHGSRKAPASHAAATVKG